jgi:hypothetical protein
MTVEQADGETSRIIRRCVHFAARIPDQDRARRFWRAADVHCTYRNLHALSVENGSDPAASTALRTAQELV